MFRRPPDDAELASLSERYRKAERKGPLALLALLATLAATYGPLLARVLELIRSRKDRA